MKTKVRTWIVLFAVAGSLLWRAPASAQTFRWKFAEGDQFSVGLTQVTTVETAIDKRLVTQETRMQLTLDWIVGTVDGEQAQIKQYFRHIGAKTTMPGENGPETFEFDSASSDPVDAKAQRMKDSFMPLIDQEIQLQVSTRGEILDVTIPKETLESLRKMPGSIQGRDALSAESIREMFMQAFVVFPENPIAVGDSWTNQRQFQLGERSFQQDNTYTYQDSSDSRDTFAIASQLQISADPQRRVDLEELQIPEQQATGKLVFDRESGNCLSSEFTLELTTQTAYRDMQVISTIHTQSTTTMQRK